MAEVTEYTYKKIRDLIDSNFKYIEIQNESNVKVLRLSTSDPRITYSYNRNSQTQTYTLVLSGDDADITLPKTLAKVLFFETSSSSDALYAESTTAFTLGAEGDTCTFTITVNVPAIN